MLIDLSETKHITELDKEELLDLQVALSCLGYYQANIDGINGPLTIRGFHNFKDENWLGSLNLIGRASVSTLLSAVEDKVGLVLKEGETVETIIETAYQFDLNLPSQLAYLLATVEHETNSIFKPVREAYWLSEHWRRQNLRYYPYYGRGFVQLTWKSNYQKYEDILNLPLVKQPDLALRQDVSAFVLVHGSKYGIFTGYKLEDFINEKQTDYEEARRVINGLDKADHIARIAKDWEQKLI